MSISVRGVSKRYGDRDVLTELSLEVDPGETVALLGPSGSGKSTLLRVVSGLDAPDRGTVEIGGVDAQDVPTHRRGVGYMFQELALFPHLDVRGIIGFGLRMQGADRRARFRRVTELLELVGLSGTEHRDPASLSGGERQRVALARALAPGPSALLLDEPFGALDKTLRDRLLGELRRIFSGLDVAVLAVTHDPDEAAALADRMAVLLDGHIAQLDEPAVLFAAPADHRVASVLGLRNVVGGTRVDRQLVTEWGRFDASHVPTPAASALIPPRAVSVAPDDQESGESGVVAEVEEIFLRDGIPTARIRPGDGVDRLDADLGRACAPGDKLRVQVDATLVHVMPRRDDGGVLVASSTIPPEPLPGEPDPH